MIVRIHHLFFVFILLLSSGTISFAQDDNSEDTPGKSVFGKSGEQVSEALQIQEENEDKATRNAIDTTLEHGFGRFSFSSFNRRVKAMAIITKMKEVAATIVTSPIFLNEFEIISKFEKENFENERKGKVKLTDLIDAIKENDYDLVITRLQQMGGLFDNDTLNEKFLEELEAGNGFDYLQKNYGKISENIFSGQFSKKSLFISHAIMTVLVTSIFVVSYKYDLLSFSPQEGTGFDFIFKHIGQYFAAFTAMYIAAKEVESRVFTKNIIIPYMKIKSIIPQAASGPLCEILVNNIMRF